MTLKRSIGLALALTMSSSFALAAKVQCSDVLRGLTKIETIKTQDVVTDKQEKIEPKKVDLKIEIDPKKTIVDIKLDEMAEKLETELDKNADLKPTEKVEKRVKRNQDLKEIDEIGQRILELEKADPEVAAALDKTKKHQQLSSKIAFWRKLAGDNLTVMEYHWLVDEYLLERNYRNGFDKQIYHDLRDHVRNTELTAYELVRARTKLNILKNEVPRNEKAINETWKEEKNLAISFAIAFNKYDKMITFHKNVIALADPTSSTEQKASARRALGKKFSAAVEAPGSEIPTRAREIEEGLHITALETNLPEKELRELLALDKMRSLFYDPKYNSMIKLMTGILWQQRIEVIIGIPMDKVLKNNIAKIAAAMPPNSKVGKAFKWFVNFNDAAFKTREHFQHVMEIMKSTGTSQDKTELLFDTAAKAHKDGDQTELQRLLVVGTTGVIAERKQLVKISKNFIGGGTKLTILQKSDRALEEKELKAPPFNGVYQNLKELAGKKSMIELTEEQRTNTLDVSAVNANDFLVYMYRLTNTRDEWIEIQQYLRAQNPEAAKGIIVDATSFKRYNAMATAEKVGDQLGEVALVREEVVQLYKAAIAGAMAASPMVIQHWADIMAWIHTLPLIN